MYMMSETIRIFFSDLPGIDFLPLRLFAPPAAGPKGALLPFPYSQNASITASGTTERINALARAMATASARSFGRLG